MTRDGASVVGRAAEYVLLACVILAPWFYGCVTDVARFSLTALLLMSGAFWLVSRARDGVSAVSFSMLALPALGVIQIVVGTSVARTWTADAALCLAAFLIAWAIVNDRCRDGSTVRRVAGALLMLGGAQALFGVIQWSLTPGRIYGRASAIVTMPFGSFVNHNHFSGLMVMIAPLALGWASGRIRRNRSITPDSVALLGLALAMIVASLASRSRGGIVALACGLGLFIVLWLKFTARIRASGKAALVAAAAGVTAVLLFGFLTMPLGTRMHLATLLRGPSESSGEYRVDLARSTLRLFWSRPFFGSGLGAFADAVTPYKTDHGDVRATHAENDVLEFSAEAGLCGLLFLLWVAWFVLRSAQESLRWRGDPVRRGLVCGALAGAGAMLVYSFLDFNLRVPSNALVVLCLLGIATAGGHALFRDVGQKATLAAASVVLTLALAAAWRAWSSWANVRAASFEDPRLRVGALTEVLSCHPWLVEAYRERALAWSELAERSRSGARQTRIAFAIRDLELALGLRPMWSQAWGDLGNLRWRNGDLSRAEVAFVEAVTMDPTNLPLGLAHAAFLARVHGPDAAITELLRLRRLNPNWSGKYARAIARRWTQDEDLLARIQ